MKKKYSNLFPKIMVTLAMIGLASFGYNHIVNVTQMGAGNGLPSLKDHSMDNYEDFLANDDE